MKKSCKSVTLDDLLILFIILLVLDLRAPADTCAAALRLCLLSHFPLLEYYATGKAKLYTIELQ